MIDRLAEERVAHSKKKSSTGGKSTVLTVRAKRTANRAQCNGRLYIDAQLFRASHSSTKGDTNMSARLSSASALMGAVSLAASGAAFGVCTGPGAPQDTQTKCLTAVQIPGNPLRSFDISFVNPHRAEFYFADRSNAAIQVIDTHHLTWKRSLGGFVGVKLNAAGNVNNNISGPDGVVSHGRWVHRGEGCSTLKVFDRESSASTVAQLPLPTGGSTRVDEMDITSDGE